MATVAGLFERYEDADRALKRLNDMGYDKDEISIVASQKAVVDKLSDTEGTKAGGAASGAVIGGLAGLLLGVGALMIPGIGPVITAGTIATMMGTTAAGAGLGAAAGGLRGALAEMDVPEVEAKFYTEGVEHGGILITVIVETEEAVREVKDAFREFNVVDVDTRRSRYEGSDWQEK